jgi:hypothetical protein
MRDESLEEPPTFTLDELCRFLEAWKGSLTLESVLRPGFVGSKVVLRLSPPNRKPIVHEALRPDERFAGRALPSFASELNQMIRHLRLAYPELDETPARR